MRECDLEALSDTQICDLARWVERELAVRGRVRCPAIGKVIKERRMGTTGKMGWRWVIYVATVDETTRERELVWVERGMCSTRKDAFAQKRRILAVEAATHARAHHLHAAGTFIERMVVA